MSSPHGSEPATQLLATLRRERAIRRFRLTVERGPDRGVEVRSESPELAIGTDPANQLVLTDPTVSRHHCSIELRPNGALLRDLGSTNGTIVSGLRIEAAYMTASVAIVLGASVLRFELLDESIKEPLSMEDRFGDVLGVSPPMRRIFATLGRLSDTDTTVLLEGETGTGKGLLAESLHRNSSRSGGPFVVVDCASIPPSLIESELFGHEKGAFTGAVGSRPGAFEHAARGTVFLDEIGELPLDLQPRLLRALEERKVKRVGALNPTLLDVRIIAATNRDLRREVNRGGFRADLYYRLNAVRIKIPPLRERREDIELLARHFHDQLTGTPELPAGWGAEFLAQDWAGNARELRSAIERRVLLGEEAGDTITKGDSSAKEAGSSNRFDGSLPFRLAKDRVVSAWERGYLADLLRENEGNVSRAARAARMDRSYLRDLCRRHGINAHED